MIKKVANDTIIRVRAQLVQNSRDNTWYRDWDNAAEESIPHCSIQPVALSSRLRYETDAEREHQLIYFQGYAPPDTDLMYTDRVKYNGQLFEMQGQPTPWNDLHGTRHHLTFMLKFREG